MNTLPLAACAAKPALMHLQTIDWQPAAAQISAFIRGNDLVAALIVAHPVTGEPLKFLLRAQVANSAERLLAVEC